MTVTMFKRGHKIYYDPDKKEWLYCDDHTSADVTRPCALCGHMPLENGEDYCLGHIPGVKAACCGHGVKGYGYILYKNNDFHELD